uniref:Uncharacterized protein n=1 Tax=Tanacetum cinerariifolium TaxID=118510 RepID=A0A6L2JY45_TANCI|nr:hypothetical protein [Tanacetum cinerariifolium]
MTSFGYRLNPRYTIKECLSCGALYTGDFFCSKGNVKDKILVPKLSKNYARCAKCGHPVNGPYCQGCALLREKLEEYLVTYFQNFKNISESSDDSTNIVNAPREPFVVKKDHGVNPPRIDKCCCECGNALDGIFCQQCICKSCGKGAHTGYNCPPKVPIVSNPEPCNQTMNNELPQTLPSFDTTCYSDKENSVPCVLKPNFVDESSNIFNPPPQPPIYSCEICRSNAQYGHHCTPQVPFTNPEPGYSQDFNFPQDIHNFQQQAGEACKRCTCAKCGSGLGKGLCYICGHNQNSLNDSLSISETSSQSPPNINHCCYECGDPLDGILCKRCTCKSYGKDAHIGYNCPSKVSVISNPEPCNNQTIDELPQTLPIFHLTFHSEAESPFTLDSTPTYVDESSNVFNPPPQSLVYPCEFCRNDAYYGHYCTPQSPFIYPEPCYNQDFNFSQDFQTLPVCYDDDDDEEKSDSLDDNIIFGLPSFSAITPDEPVLSTEEPDNSLSMGDEHLDTILATESDEFIKSSVETLIPILSESEGIPEHVCDVPSHDNSPPLDVSKDQIEDFSESNEDFSLIDDDSFSNDDIDYVEASPPDYELVSSEVMEIVIPEVGGIDDDILLTIEHEGLREKLRNVNLLISKIEALNANPTSSSDCKTKSSFTSLNSLLEETNTFDNSLLEFETFCFDVEEISSGSTTTHSDSSLYASFMFDLSINPFPPADRSDSYELTNELIPFVSPPEYDCFLFKVEPNSRDFTKDVVEDVSLTKEPQVLNALPTHPTLQLNLKFQPSNESFFAYVVWIFLPFLVYSVVPCYLLSLRNEDIIFDPGICKSTFSRPDLSHRYGTVKKFNTHRSHLNKFLMLIHGQNNPPLDVLLFHFYPL